MLYCYFGHHKCASVWLTQLVNDIAKPMGLKVFERQMILLPNPAQNIKDNHADFYITSNSIYSIVQTLDNYRGFHVIRDPRDIVVSGYFSHLYSHAINSWTELEEHRKLLNSIDKDEGILREIDFSAQFLKLMYEWNYNDPNILELRMEDVTGNPRAYIKNILQFLGLYEESNTSIATYKTIQPINEVLRKANIRYKIPVKINDNYIDYLSELRSFKNMSKGRKKSEEDVKSHYRKGVANDWKNHFKPMHLEYFNQKYPDIITKLGYKE